MSEPSLGRTPRNSLLKILGLFPAVVGHDLVPVEAGGSGSDSEEEAREAPLTPLGFLLPFPVSFLGLGLRLVVTAEGPGEVSFFSILIFIPSSDSIFLLDTCNFLLISPSTEGSWIMCSRLLSLMWSSQGNKTVFVKPKRVVVVSQRLSPVAKVIQDGHQFHTKK